MRNVILCGDVRTMLKTLPDESVNCVVTSPPYWGLRDYGTASWEGGEDGCAHRVRDERAAAPGSAKQASSAGANYVYAGDCRCGAKRVDSQLGLEATPDKYVVNMVAVFREVRRVLRDDGTVWLNLGDSYAGSGKGSGGAGTFSAKQVSNAGSYQVGEANFLGVPAGLKPKDLIGVPWRVAFALQADGWWLRSDIIWSKPNPMPESVTDRPTRAHEYVFLLSKSARYYYDAEAIREPVNGTAHARHAAGKDPSLAFKMQEPGMGNRNNPSFQSYMHDLPPEWGRNRRTVWEIATEPFNGSDLMRHGDGGGSGRTVSPDCPVHGDRKSPASTAPNDEQPDAFPSVRNPNTYVHLDPGLEGEPVAIETRPAVDSVLGSSDLPGQSCAVAATLHSTESHKMGHGQPIALHDGLDAQLPNHIDDSEQSPVSGASADRIHENNTEAGFFGDVQDFGQPAQRIDRSVYKCTCTIIDHFAVFPTALVKPCILAGCPEGGIVLDPFFGSGTTGLVAARAGRDWIGIELNPAYVEMAEERLASVKVRLL